MIFTLRDIRRALGIVPILAAGVWPGGACKAELPEQIGGDAGVDLPCTTYADQLVAYSPPGTEGGSDLGLKVLGAPDNDSVALSTNASLSVAFLGLGGIVEKEGNDLRVHGSVGVDAQIAVYVGFGDGDFEYSGSLSSDDLNVDITQALTRVISHVQLVGISGESSIDAFESIQTRCP